MMTKIPVGWKETTLGDVVFIQPGFAFKSSDFEGINCNFVVKIKNIQPPFVEIDKNDTVNVSNYSDEKLKKFVIKKGDYLVAMTGETIGKVGKYLLDFDSYLNQRVCKFVDIQKSDYKFIYYAILDPKFQKYINAFSFGAAQANISTTEIGNFPIHLPPLPEQQAIAAVLSSFDDKIELLRAENQTLEQMGQELFKERFGKWKVGDELPEGWRVGTLGEMGTIICGKTPSKNNPDFFGGNIPFIKIPDMHGNLFILKTEDSLTEEGANSQKNKYIPEGAICVSCIATVGLVSLITRPSQTNQQINSIIPSSNNYREYLYYTLIGMKNELLAMGAAGSATLNINTSSFSNISIIVPDQETLSQFDLVMKPLFSKIKANSEQIQTLSAIRDLLLPKLMSGEVRVEF